MKNIDIVGITNTYRQTNGELRLPASVSWKRRLNMKKLLEAEAVIQDAVQEIQRKFTDDEHSFDENGNRQVKPEFIADYCKQIQEIYDQDTPIEIQKIRIEELGNTEISDKEMDTLAFMIEETD